MLKNAVPALDWANLMREPSPLSDPRPGLAASTGVPVQWPPGEEVIQIISEHDHHHDQPQPP